VEVLLDVVVLLVVFHCWRKEETRAVKGCGERAWKASSTSTCVLVLVALPVGAFI
jgi:hypothetical protein